MIGLRTMRKENWNKLRTDSKTLRRQRRTTQGNFGKSSGSLSSTRSKNWSRHIGTKETSLAQYIQLAEDFEALQDKEARQIERTQGNTAQFRRQPGRTSGNPPRLFCWVCG